MSPPEPPKRPARPGSRSDLKPVLDQTPEEDVIEQRRFDLPKRAATLTGLPAPAAPGSHPPPPPRLPGELAPTLKAPPNPLQHLTIRRPTPPSAAMLARRTPVPPPIDAPAAPVATGVQPDPSLPPPSASPGEAVNRAQRRALDAKDAELERERRDRQKLELQLEIERERNKKSTPPPKPWIDERLVKAMVALLGAVTALGTPLGIWLTAKATANESAQQRQGKAAQDATTTASSAKAESSTASKELEELRLWKRSKRAYDREVFRRMGVIIPKVEGDPDPPQLDVEVPLRKPGTVTPGPVLIVKTPPP